MACGCSQACTCSIVSGTGIAVSGNGSLANPYVITNTGEGSGGGGDNTCGLCPIMQVTTDTVLTTDDFTVIVDPTAGPVTITLPNSPPIGTEFRIKTRQSGSTGNQVDIQTSGGQIDEGSVTSLIGDFEAKEVVYDGTDWWVF